MFLLPGGDDAGISHSESREDRDTPLRCDEVELRQ
jgi:hypothetical protein